MVPEQDMQTTRRHFYIVLPERRQRVLKPTHRSIIAWHILVLIYCCYSKLSCCDAQSTDPVRMLDLSYTFDDTTLYWAMDQKLNFTVIHNGTDSGNKYWYQSEAISAATHGGTHMDAPCHFAIGRWCISDIPLHHLVTSAVIVDISNEVGDNPNVHLTADHLKEWEKLHGKIPDGSLLLVRTGWSRFWPDLQTYAGTTERDVTLRKFPSIEPGAAKWLVANRNIVGVGIDTMSVDKTTPELLRDTHVSLMERNIYALENVNLAEPLPPTGVKVYAMPMKLKSASGAPCRVFAEVSKDATNGDVSSSYSISQMCTLVVVVVFWTFRNRRL